MTGNFLIRPVILSLLWTLFCSGGNLLAFQPEEPARRHFYGGFLGFEFTHVMTQVEGAPIIGYRITPRLHAGAGIKYQYFRSRQVDRMFSSHIWGPVAFTDFIVVKDLEEFLPFRFLGGAFMIHAEMNYFNLPVSRFGENNGHEGQTRFFRPTWLTGAGLRTRAGAGNALIFLVMMDVSGHSNPVYSNPVIRFGFVF